MRSEEIIEQTNAAAARLEAANREAKDILERQEKLKSNEILGGQTIAGAIPEKPKEETPKEYAKRIINGG